MSDVRIKSRVIVREVLRPRLCRATLPNGKIITAYIRNGDLATPMKPGDERFVLLSLCNFSEGRLLSEPIK